MAIYSQGSNCLKAGVDHPGASKITKNYEVNESDHFNNPSWNSSSGFTLIEFVFTILILGIIGWILTEIMRQPISQFLASATQSHIIYLSDLALHRIEYNLHHAKLDSLVVSQRTVSFTNQNNLSMKYLCEKERLIEHLGNQSALLADGVDCQFNRLNKENYSRVTLQLYFKNGLNGRIPYVREVYLKDATT